MSLELDRNQHQGYFGECFVRVLASAAGLIVSKADLDVTGDDFTISHRGVIGSTRHPKIDVQVKTSRTTDRRGQYWNYSLKAQHFNELAGTDFPLYRYLFLVIVPQDWTDYATVVDNSLRLKHLGYWVSLRDRQRVNTRTTTRVPVAVPHANVLTVETLRGLMTPAGPARREA